MADLCAGSGSETRAKANGKAEAKIVVDLKKFADGWVTDSERSYYHLSDLRAIKMLVKSSSNIKILDGMYFFWFITNFFNNFHREIILFIIIINGKITYNEFSRD